MSSGGNLPFAREHIYLHIGELEMRTTINDDEAVKNTKKKKKTRAIYECFMYLNISIYICSFRPLYLIALIKQTNREFLGGSFSS